MHEPLDIEYSILKQRLARRLQYEGESDDTVGGLDLVGITKVCREGVGRLGHVESWEAQSAAGNLPLGPVGRGRACTCRRTHCLHQCAPAHPLPPTHHTHTCTLKFQLASSCAAAG